MADAWIRADEGKRLPQALAAVEERYERARATLQDIGRRPSYYEGLGFNVQDVRKVVSLAVSVHGQRYWTLKRGVPGTFPLSGVV